MTASKKAVMLTTNRIDAAPHPATGRTRLADEAVRGLYVRITPTSKSFYFRYKLDGRRQDVQLGVWPDMSIKRARELAREMRSQVTEGHDPAAAKKERREAPTMNDLWERYWAAHGCRKRSGDKDQERWGKHVRGRLGRRRVAEITHEDVVRLHHQVGKKAPGAANLTVALLSKMFNLAERWKLIPRGSNPARGVEKFEGRVIERYLTKAEYAALFKTLDKSDDYDVALDAIRLLALTGMRATEPLGATVLDLDVGRSELLLERTKTGRRRIRLAPPALAVLQRRAAAAGPDGLLFPGRRGGPLKYGALRAAWLKVRSDAKIEDVRLHDLRHSFASVGADAGLSLVEIGGLLGHKTPLTTQRYVHLFDDSQQRAATAVAGRIVEAAE